MTSITSPAQNTWKIFIRSTALRPVYTGDRYTLPVYTGRRAEKHCMSSFFCTGRMYGPYIRAPGTHHPYIRAVYTARIYGCKKCARIYGPYIRAVYTGSVYWL